MTRPLPFVLRTWIWRLAGALAVLLVVLVVQALHALREPEPARPAWLEEVERAGREAGPAPTVACRVTLDEIRETVRGWIRWGAGEEPRARAPETPVLQAPLPLRAFKLALWIHDETGPDAILIRSKDPAHPEAYQPREGEPDRGVRIVGIERDGLRARIAVARGEDRHVFETEDVGRKPPPAAIEAGAVTLRPAPEAAGAARVEGMANDVKVVPFRGEDGSVIGARVTGVRPGGWFQRAGLRPGDVVERVNGEELAALDLLLVAAAEGRVRTMRVRRAQGERTEVLDLGG